MNHRIITFASVAALACAGAAAAQQGPLQTLKLDHGAQSAAETGTLRCDVGDEAQFSLQGEDASMSKVDLEPYAPEAHSTNPTAFQAAERVGSGYVVVNVRCLADGEGWISASAGGKVANFPVLVGKARRQAAVKAPAPTAPPEG